jgi:hypothetical protein
MPPRAPFAPYIRGALLGVGLNAWLGWWWTDPAAALAVKEGVEVWGED